MEGFSRADPGEDVEEAAVPNPAPTEDHTASLATLHLRIRKPLRRFNSGQVPPMLQNG